MREKCAWTSKFPYQYFFGVREADWEGIVKEDREGEEGGEKESEGASDEERQGDGLRGKRSEWKEIAWAREKKGGVWARS